MENLEEVLNQALAFYADDKLFQASRKFEVLTAEVAKMEKDSTVPSTEKQKLSEFKTKLSSDPKVLKIRQQSSECASLLHDCTSKESWEMCYDGQSTKVHYRKEPDSPVHSVRVRGILNVDFVKLASLIYETDLYKLFWWFVRDMKEIKKLGRCEKALHGIYQIFFPIRDREIPILGYGCDGLDEDDSFVLFFRSLREDDRDIDGKVIGVPKQPSGTIRIEMKVAGMRFIPVSRNAVDMTIIANLDPKISFVPRPLLNWATRSVFRFGLRILESKANELHNMPHMERMQTDPFYEWFNSRVEDYFRSHPEKIQGVERGRTSFDPEKEQKAAKPPRLALLGLK